VRQLVIKAKKSQGMNKNFNQSPFDGGDEMKNSYKQEEFMRRELNKFEDNPQRQTFLINVTIVLETFPKNFMDIIQFHRTIKINNNLLGK
jgi:hypothetical protein